MMIDTARGPIDASRLAVSTSQRTTYEGTLISTSYYLDGELVKLDQHMQVSEAVMTAIGSAQL